MEHLFFVRHTEMQKWISQEYSGRKNVFYVNKSICSRNMRWILTLYLLLPVSRIFHAFPSIFFISFFRERNGYRTVKLLTPNIQNEKVEKLMALEIQKKTKKKDRLYCHYSRRITEESTNYIWKCRIKKQREYLITLYEELLLAMNKTWNLILYTHYIK